jgi:hypothetical protein
MPASSMSSLARAERVAERAKSKQRPVVQEPPKKKPKNKGSQPADQGAQEPRTQDALLSSPGPLALSAFPSFDSTNPSPEDYNERTPERTDLLTRLKNHLKDNPITSTFWACFQLCDTACLEYLVNVSEMRPNHVLAYSMSLCTLPLLCKSLDFQGLLRLY